MLRQPLVLLICAYMPCAAQTASHHTHHIFRFSKLLDSKCGVTLRPEALARDRRAYRGRGPLWSEKEYERQFAEQGNIQYPKRSGETFIMDSLQTYMNAAIARASKEVDDLIAEVSMGEDVDLSLPYLDALNRAKLLATTGFPVCWRNWRSFGPT